VGTDSTPGNLIDYFGDNWPVLIGRHEVGISTIGSELAMGDLLINNPGFGAAPFFHAPTMPLIPSVGVPGNGDQIHITNVFVGGLLQVFEGHNAANAESITVGAAGAPVSTNDLDLQVNTNPGDNITIIVTNSLVRDASGTLAFNINDGPNGSDLGAGNDTIVLGGAGPVEDPLGIGGGPLTVNSQMQVFAAVGGNNNVLAENVSASMGILDGGGSPSSSFVGFDPMFGNSDLTASNFGNIH
jgi:hypothetical protein